MDSNVLKKITQWNSTSTCTSKVSPHILLDHWRTKVAVCPLTPPHFRSFPSSISHKICYLSSGFHLGHFPGALAVELPTINAEDANKTLEESWISPINLKPVNAGAVNHSNCQNKFSDTAVSIPDLFHKVFVHVPPPLGKHREQLLQKCTHSIAVSEKELDTKIRIKMTPHGMQLWLNCDWASLTALAHPLQLL